jgi:hypothetical protein
MYVRAYRTKMKPKKVSMYLYDNHQLCPNATKASLLSAKNDDRSSIVI